MMTLDEGGWRRPVVRVIAPPEQLREIVELFWVDAWPRAEASLRRIRIVADDAPHVLWHVERGQALRTQGLSLVGARTRHHDTPLGGRCLLVGARLRPGAVRELSGLPAAALTDGAVALDAILSPVATRAIRRLRPRSADDALHALTLTLESMRMRPRIDERALWIANLDRTMTPSISAVARTFGMSPRGVRAWSVATFGMGLKRLLSIRRLHAALELRLSGAHETWSQVAAATGYADQSHLNRDCRSLLGESPAAFAARAV